MPTSRASAMSASSPTPCADAARARTWGRNRPGAPTAADAVRPTPHQPRTEAQPNAQERPPLPCGVMTLIPVNIADWVGRTPMVQLTRLLSDAPGELFAKLEMFNPGGSVKDRIGVAMIEAAEAEGRIEPGRTTIVEATSGNTGIALAFVAAAKGYDLVLT